MGPPTTPIRPALHPRSDPNVQDARRRYREYRRRQGFRLLSLLPRGAVRPLYRRAREWAVRRGEVADPLTLLLEFCQELLPLPPFDVWREDRSAHPAAHLDESAADPEATGPSPPVTVEVRPFEAGGASWNAALCVHPDGSVWRGHITFHPMDGGSRSYPTGQIFSEDEAGAVRTRFLDFDDRTLRAFLRSALP